jgi:hypothetical protein
MDEVSTQGGEQAREGMTSTFTLPAAALSTYRKEQT